MTTAELERPIRGGFSRRATDHRELPRHEIDLHVLDAVDGAGGATDLFPSVRLSDDSSAALARRSLPEFDAHASASTWIVGQGLKLLDPAERQGIIEGWRVHHRGRWPSLIVDDGCDVRIGRSVVTDRVRAILLEWLPLSPIDLAVYEGGLFRRSPAHALALIVRPPTIWTIDEAVAADRLAPPGRRFVPARFDAVERHARGRLCDEQLTHLRAAVSKIETQLPLHAFPVASATVAAGCAVIAVDDDWCAVIAARQLARYATSALVAREASVRDTS